MQPKLATALLVLALVAGTAGASPIVQSADQQTLRSVNDTDAEVAFGEDTVEVGHGGTATIPIHFDGADTATVKVGSANVNYVVLVTVTDANGDGEAELLFDTDAVEEPSETLVTTTDAGDAASVKSVVEEHFGGQPPHPPLDPGNYDLVLFVGDVTEGDEMDAATMKIQERTTTVTTTTATTTTVTTTTTAATTSEVATETTTGNPMQSTTATTTAVTDPEPGIPGFGFGVAVVALAVAAMLAARR